MLLPTARTVAILRELQGETVSIEVTSDATWIRGERAEYRLGVEDPAEFPPVAEFAEKSYHTIAAGLLKQLIRRTVFATDAESTRYALGGVLIDLKGTRSRLPRPTRGDWRSPADHAARKVLRRVTIRPLSFRSRRCK